MRFQLRQSPQPEAALLGTLWSFVTGRMGPQDFEAFVYDNMSALVALFTGEALSDLVELNYRTANVEALRSELRESLEDVDLECECPKIPKSVAMDIGFLQHIVGSEELFDYVTILSVHSLWNPLVDHP